MNREGFKVLRLLLGLFEHFSTTFSNSSLYNEI